MPEFRLRRKKQNRRTTVNNADETARQIQEAKKLVKPVLEVTQEETPAETQDQVVPNGDVSRGIGVGEVDGFDGFDGESRSSIEKRNSFIQEREKFFELLKTKYPEQANSLDVGVANSLDVGVVKEDVGETRRRRSSSSLSPEQAPMVCRAVQGHSGWSALLANKRF